MLDKKDFALIADLVHVNKAVISFLDSLIPGMDGLDESRIAQKQLLRKCADEVKALEETEKSEAKTADKV